MNSVKSSEEDAKHTPPRDVRGRKTRASLLHPLGAGSVVHAETPVKAPVKSPVNGQAAARETINDPTFMVRTARQSLRITHTRAFQQ
jgi:hypothetical protein